MSEQPQPAAADQSHRTMDLFLELINEVIDHPEVAERLPDTGRVELRWVELRGHDYLMAAFKPPDDETWTAHIVRATPSADSPEFQGSVGDNGGVLRAREAIVRTLTATGTAGKAALAALEHELRSRVEQEIGIPATTGTGVSA